MGSEYEQLKKDILFEEAQLDIVVSKIKEIEGNITEVNLAALAAYLMNFYNGIENIMKRCAKEYYKKIPTGDDWHKELLERSCLHNRNKIPLFNEGAVEKLYGYLTFRHFFIHGYSFKLNWEKVKPLVDDIDGLWQKIKSQLGAFIEKI